MTKKLSRNKICEQVAAKLQNSIDDYSNAYKEMAESYTTIVALADSLEESLDNQREYFENTQRFQTLEETYEALDQARDLLYRLIGEDNNIDTVSEALDLINDAYFPPMMPGGGRKKTVAN